MWRLHLQPPPLPPPPLLPPPPGDAPSIRLQPGDSQPGRGLGHGPPASSESSPELPPAPPTLYPPLRLRPPPQPRAASQPRGRFLSRASRSPWRPANIPELLSRQLESRHCRTTGEGAPSPVKSHHHAQPSDEHPQAGQLRRVSSALDPWPIPLDPGDRQPFGLERGSQRIRSRGAPRQLRILWLSSICVKTPAAVLYLRTQVCRGPPCLFLPSTFACMISFGLSACKLSRCVLAPLVSEQPKLILVCTPAEDFSF